MTRSRDHEWWIGALRNAPLFGPIVLLFLLMLMFTFLAPNTFWTVGNFKNVLVQNSVMAILGIGLTLVILLGQIDLSFPGIVMVSAASVGLFYSGTKVGLPIFGNVSIGTNNQLVAILAAVAIGVILGILNGVMIAGVGVPSFIGSLGVLLLAEGWAYYWLNGQAAYSFPPWIISLGRGSWGPVPVIVICALVVAGATHLMLRKTIFGRYIYMTGANRNAARLSGVNTARVTMIVYVLAGLLAAVAGMAYAGNLASVNGTSGEELLLPTFAAVVLGGNSLFGGSGGVTNTLTGVLLYGILQDGLLLVNLNIFLLPLLEGVLVVVAVVLNVGLGRLARIAASRAGPGSSGRSNRVQAMKTSLRPGSETEGWEVGAGEIPEQHGSVTEE
jgi:ribose transport system permease protein